MSGRILAQLAVLKPKGLIFDIGSLKTPLRDGLEELRSAGCQITSLHPMYGPNTRLLSGRHLIFVEVGCPEATAAAKDLFSATMVDSSREATVDSACNVAIGACRPARTCACVNV